MSKLKTSKKTTIVDVAKDAGVSFKTVSRVVNKIPTVADDIRIKVEASIKKLHYQPNESARNMRVQRSRLIGFPMISSTNSYYFRIFDAALDALKECHYKLMTYPVKLQNFTTEAGIQTIASLIEESRVEGILLPAPFSNDVNIHAWLTNNAIPYATIGQIVDVGNALFTTCNIAQSVADLTQHIIDQGHTNIAFLKGPEHLLPASERYKGFCQAMQKNALDINPEWIVQGNFDLNTGHSEAYQLLKLPHRPTAIICANDSSALGVLQAAYRLKIGVPADLSVTGFDDLPEAVTSSVPLTTVSQPIVEMTEKALQALTYFLDNGKIPKYDPLCLCRLKIRHSTAPKSTPI